MELTETERIKLHLLENAKNSMAYSKFIDTLISEFKNSDKVKEMKIGGQYYRNSGDIKEKKRTIVNEDGIEEIAPHAKNYQIQHPILYKMINQKTGYLLRKKPNIKQIIDDEQKEDKEYQKVLNDIFNNKMHKRLKYTLIEAVKRGIAWWQVYVDEDGELKVRLRYATRIIPLWQDEEHEILDAIIMFYDVQEYVSETEKKTITKVEYWDLEGVRYYIYDKDSLIEDVQMAEQIKDYKISVDNEGTSIFAHFKINDKLCVWDKIPFVYFKYNGDEMPLIHFLKTMLDCYDELVSKMGDAIYEAPDGVNVVKNYQDIAGTFQKNLATFNTVFLETDGEYKRETIEIKIDAFKVYIEQLRKDIYEGGSGVDTQSEKFGTQDSGVAIKQLYADLDLDCSNIETEFKSSIEYFMYFINKWTKITKRKDCSKKEIELVFNKTMTVNEKELIENCKNSIDIISKASILANHPYVSSVEDEQKKIKVEKEEEEAEANEEYDKLLNNMKKNSNKKVGDTK